jgi:hypothetical protein
MYKVGDKIPNVGIVEFNHCGVPYVACNAGLYYGVCQVRKYNGDSIFYDMKSGKALTSK